MAIAAIARVIASHIVDINIKTPCDIEETVCSLADKFNSFHFNLFVSLILRANFILSENLPKIKHTRKAR